MAANIDTYKRRAGTNAELGHKFETDVMFMTYVRCLKMYKMNKLKTFKIASNVDYIGAFDDTVCRIEYEENGYLKTRLIFIQTKHKESPKKHSFSDDTLSFVSNRKKTDRPPIYKYIKSYLTIQEIFHENGHYEKFTDKYKPAEEIKKIIESLRNAFQCKLEDAQFVYYTNAKEGEMQYFEEIQNSDIVTNILGTSPTGGMYKFKLNKTELFNLFPELRSTLSQNEIDSVQQFLSNFFVYVCQESGQRLEEIIKNDISCCISNKGSDVDTLCKTFIDEMKIVLQSEYIPFITEKVNYIEEINSFLELRSQTIIERVTCRQRTKIFSAETINQFYSDIKKQKLVNVHYRNGHKSIAFIKCLQLAENLETINKNFLFLYISKDFFDMWKAVRNLNSYTKFSEVLVCIDNVPMEEIHHVFSSEIRTTELIATISENNNVSEPSLWKQLSASEKEQIMNDNVTFQGELTTLKEIFGDIYLQEILDHTDDQKVLDSFFSRVLNNEVVNIGNSLPVNDDIYIERRYKLNATFLKFEALKEDRDSFIIFPIQNVASSLNVGNLQNVLIFENEQNARSNFYSRLENNQNTHLCYVNTSLMVIVSHGTMSNILKYKTDSDRDNVIVNISDYEIYKDEVNEETFIQYTMKNKCTFISDDVGMGKSTALKQLSNYIKTRCKDKWVEFISLNLNDKKLKNIKCETNPIDVVLHLLNLNDLERMIFQHKCSTDGNVALLFDGFDEISNESRKYFHHLVQYISKTKINTIVVSTRPNVETELKYNILSYHFKISCFSYNDMNSYLIKCWSKYIGTNCSEKLKKIVQNIVNQAKAMKEILKDIIAVPLQTKMLAETYDQEIKEILSSEKSLQTIELLAFNLYSLYNNFIDMHIDRCIQEKFEIRDDNTNNYELLKRALFKKNSGIWETIACKEIFPSNKICEVTESDIDELAKERIGIFVKTDVGTVTFVHRSFAEFLAAKYLSRLVFQSKNTENLHFIYQTIFVDRTLYVLRKFMNAIYKNEKDWENAEITFVPNLVVDDKLLIITTKEENAFLFKVILRHLTKNEDVLNKILNQKDEYNKSNLLHLSVKYFDQVFDDILNSKFFHCAKDFNHKYRTAFHVACKYGKENCVISYLNKLKKESISALINQNDKYGDTPLLSAASKGRTNVIEILQQHGISINNKSELGKNALMSAAFEGYIETVKYLLEQGTQINETNCEGRTALIWACIGIDKCIDLPDDDYFDCKRYECFVEIIRYLVEQAEADINIADCKGKTALMHLAENDIFHDNSKCLIQHEADIKAVDSEGRSAVIIAAEHGAIEIVKYLVEVGEDIVNQVDAKGNTGLILKSLRVERPSGLQYLIEIGSNLNHQNNDGDTALIAAASSNKCQNVKFLIEHGANVNICNNQGKSALIAASKYRTDLCGPNKILTYLLENGAQVNHRNFAGNSSLHFAAVMRDVEDIILLVENGADISVKNYDGITPVMKALENNREDVKVYFQELIKSRASSM